MCFRCCSTPSCSTSFSLKKSFLYIMTKDTLSRTRSSYDLNLMRRYSVNVCTWVGGTLSCYNQFNVCKECGSNLSIELYTLKKKMVHKNEEGSLYIEAKNYFLVLTVDRQEHFKTVKNRNVVTRKQIYILRARHLCAHKLSKWCFLLSF